MGTESWLSADISDAEISPPGYTILRRDRDSNNQHGGVLQAIKSDLIATRKAEFESNCEILWSQLQIQGRKSILFGTYYNPNGRDKTSLEELDISILNIGKKIDSHDIILGGDFNIPNIY